MKWCWTMVAACFLLVGGVVSAQTQTDEFSGRVAEIYFTCRDEIDSGPETDLEELAKAEGLSREEMAELLMQLVNEGLDENASADQRYLADCALWGLGPFAGEKEFIFVRNLVRATKDVKGIRRTAIMVGPRMAPEKWEEWLREVMADERSDNYDRFLVLQAAFQIGRDGDEKTRRRVVEVFEEMKTRGVSDANQRHLDEWIAELEKVP